MSSSHSERASFEAFYAENRSSIGRALAVTLRDDHLACEALDEAMLRVVRALGDGKIDVLDANGSVRTTFRVEELTQALNDAAATQPPPRLVILHSDDGANWSSASINDITGGRPGDVAWVLSTAEATTAGIYVDVSEDPKKPSLHLNVLVADVGG